jgi:NAD(P)-dependent dehydrogenase (short-subunit alcohol dehydrogenase family)
MRRNQVVCISGCSSGIGRALAERLATQGATVYAGMRDLRTAPQLAGVQPLQLDVTRPEEILAALQLIERQSGRLDVLINNAGINAMAPWEVIPAEIVTKIFAVNFFGAVALTKAALPLMRRQRGGTILMISSLSAHIALPLGGAYAASKFALDAFAESLSYEVRPWRIRVLSVSPGGYETGLDAHAWRLPMASCGPYASLCETIDARSGAGAGAAHDAADRVITVLDAGGNRLRHSLDETGREVFRLLGLENESAREAIVRKASGLAWWFDQDPERL